MKTEVEAKFVARDLAPLQRLAAQPDLGSASLGDAAAAQEVDRYLDTDDGRLASVRWACRLRTRDGTTRISLKGPAEPGSGGWRHRRPEVEGPAGAGFDPATWPASPARDLLLRLSGGRTLKEGVRLDQVRTERSVSLPNLGRIGTLTLDHVRMSGARSDLGELFVVELELDHDSVPSEAVLDELAAALERIDGLEVEPRSKLEHALERLGAA